MKTTNTPFQAAKLLKKSLITTALLAATSNVAFATDCNNDGILDSEQMQGLIETIKSFDTATNDFICRSYDAPYNGFDPLDRKLVIRTAVVNSEYVIDFTSQAALNGYFLDENIKLGDPGIFFKVYFNGNYVGNIFDGNTDATISFTQEQWNSNSVDGNVEHDIHLVASEAACGTGYHNNTFNFPDDVTAGVWGDHDQDNNGWLDTCGLTAEDHSGIPDSDGDGIVDSIDTAITIADPSIVNGLGEVMHVPFYDQDQDGDVDILDLDSLDASAGFSEVLKVLHASRGADVAADPRLHQTLKTFDLVNSPQLPAKINYDDANTYAQELFGSQLASIDKFNVTTELSQEEQIAQLSELMAQAGGSHWIGLKWSTLDTEFKWKNGQLFDTSAMADVPSASNWVNGGNIPGSGFFTPGQDDYCVVAWGTQQQQWLNTDCVTASLDEETVTGFAVNLPAPTVAEAPVTTTETVSVKLTSPQNGKHVAAGQQVFWSIEFDVSNDDNQGLALMVTDLVPANSNPAEITLTPAHIPASLSNMAAPNGFVNEHGFGGHVNNNKLEKIGGAQNTLGNTSVEHQYGQSAHVVTNLGQNGTTVFTQGSFTAPSVEGNYQFNLANTIASVLKTVNRGNEGAEIVAANIDSSASSLSFTVADQGIPELTLVGNADVTHEIRTTYVDEGAKAFDAEDGDITDQIKVANSVNPNVLGHYTVTYNVTDSDNSSAEQVTRNVSVTDTTPPLFTLNGETSITLGIGELFRDRSILDDNYEGDITHRITKDFGNYDGMEFVGGGTYTVYNNVGEYNIYYTVGTDSSGNTAVDSAGNTVTQIARRVKVIDPHVGNGSFTIDHIDDKTGDTSVNGGSGTDTFSFKGAPGGIYVNMMYELAFRNGFGGSTKLYNFENITGTDFDDKILGDDSKNIIKGLKGNDLIKGNGGNDKLEGGNGNDSLYGGTGKDWLSGQSGNDKLFGDADNDSLGGGAGNDQLNGGAGSDFLTGGKGKDLFIFDSAVGTDNISDFYAQQGDKIIIKRSAFGGIAHPNQVRLNSRGLLTIKGNNGVSYKVAQLNKYHGITHLPLVLVFQ